METFATIWKHLLQQRPRNSDFNSYDHAANTQYLWPVKIEYF